MENHRRHRTADSLYIDDEDQRENARLSSQLELDSNTLLVSPAVARARPEYRHQHSIATKACHRSDAGKPSGRKYQLIHRGLFHNHLGYVCPFCPDREHKYPRPHDLQRYEILTVYLWILSGKI